MGDRGELHKKSEGFSIFSTNPDKAWCEKFYLLYSCIWPILFVLWAMSGYYLLFGDIGNNLIIILMGAPNIIIPYLYCPQDENKKSIFEYYWVKFNIWILIFSFVASYVYSEYFFDILGMIYNFPHLKWNLNATLIGTTKQKVPLMMYTCAWFYFITYHILSNIIIRIVMKLLYFLPMKKSIGVIIAAWLCAYGELYGTTMECLHEQFHYKSMDWALKWGSVYYSIYFIVSFPMLFPMDECKTNIRKWTIEYTILNALSASMIVFLVLDIFAKFIII